MNTLVDRGEGSIDPTVDLAAATIKQAIRDLRCPIAKHRASARAFLQQAGLLETVQSHYGIVLQEEPRQLELWT